LNSLFKVLFNFPSRYLFAIGLGVIFSLTWSLPRTLSCTPKQLDSKGKSQHSTTAVLRAYHPLWAVAPVKVDLDLPSCREEAPPEHHIPRDRDGRRFGAGLCPFHSPLLRASRLFSFPPLINMLKFGGSPCLLSGRKTKKLVLFFLRRKKKNSANIPRSDRLKKSDKQGSLEGKTNFQRVSPLKRNATFKSGSRGTSKSS
jgi:hypothetical protein